MIPTRPQIADTIRLALAEDIGPGDITTSACVPPTRMAQGDFLAKQDGVLSGLYVVRECLHQAAPDCALEALVEEGVEFAVGDVLARVSGPAAQILTAERLALNFLQRLCGVATLTRRFVRAVSGTRAAILDTRKTTPGLRLLEKAAVRAGGGANHRFALYDGIIIKDNHIEAAGGIENAVRMVRERAPHTLKIEVETTSMAEIDRAIAAGADVIMLDNMDCDEMKAAVARIGQSALTEASGGVSLDTVAAIAETGVDFISVGKLTHSARAIDISLELRAQ